MLCTRSTATAPTQRPTNAPPPMGGVVISGQDRFEPSGPSGTRPSTGLSERPSTVQI